MEISEKGLALIKRHEGCHLTAYPDPATGGAPWTIGYGRAHGVINGHQIPIGVAEQYLREDIQWVQRELDGLELTQNQFDALCSLIYNIGTPNFRRSTLLKLLKVGNMIDAAAQFQRWNKAAGKVMRGLTIRRAAERELFLKEPE